MTQQELDKHYKDMAERILKFAKDTLKYDGLQMMILDFLNKDTSHESILYWYERIVIDKDVLHLVDYDRMTENLFAYDNKNILAFCDMNGSLSGKTMKVIGDTQPWVIKKLKEIILKDNLKIGDIVITGRYVFVIVRKHYANKVTSSTIKGIIPNIVETTNGMELKCYTEDFPLFVDELNSLDNFTWKSKAEKI